MSQEQILAALRASRPVRPEQQGATAYAIYAIRFEQWQETVRAFGLDPLTM